MNEHMENKLIILDNASSHRNAKIKELFAAHVKVGVLNVQRCKITQSSACNITSILCAFAKCINAHFIMLLFSAYLSLCDRLFIKIIYTLVRINLYASAYRFIHVVIQEGS